MERILDETYEKHLLSPFKRMIGGVFFMIYVVKALFVADVRHLIQQTPS